MRKAMLVLVVVSLALRRGDAETRGRGEGFSPRPRVTVSPRPPVADHQAAFERIKKLEGKWIGKSTRGWTEEKSYEVIAGGSVVMSRSFDAHPGETMATMFHLDRGRLMLTHYCIAKNQPRLVASDISEDGKTITFTFLDGTGLASRDQGHMDKAVFQFVDDDHFTGQWTWYQNGQERWMEKIACERIRPGAK